MLVQRRAGLFGERVDGLARRVAGSALGRGGLGCEQVRVELPTPSSEPVTARLLDRTGKPLAVPVTTAVRDDSDGSRWQTAQVALAPLAPGDYVIEMAVGDKRMITAFRVIP